MIMQIRLDQPFTLPRSLKDFTRKNLKTLYPYFHKHIIDTDKKIHNNLNVNAIPYDKALQTLVSEMDKLLDNLPFEAYCLVHTKDMEKIKASGIKTPAKSIFTSKTLKRLKSGKLSEEKLAMAETLMEEYDKPYEIDFFMPYDDKYLAEENRLFWDESTMNKIFATAIPEAVNLLKQAKNTYLVKCIIRYKHFSDEDKNTFIIEVLKHFTYSLMTGYNYPIKFKSTTTHGIKAAHILNVTEL